ncbi:Sucrase/ferredoxin-like-domain-containing protein [Massariosphaeria phaeospora]|uniref:Altered inheritance of mitochondria protein 32 n=1 Tax=Massariosphaeria phaeospora TaxID=100035 RepID=A0A7C8IFR2_9PLEO|nr:Sucrase/ferredoxin-like-domain-containing protein [Massariosphaeria phaeospora]
MPPPAAHPPLSSIRPQNMIMPLPSLRLCFRLRPPPFRALRPLSTTTPTIPYTPTCPPATCPCAATPPDLDIDRATPLLNTMAAYAEHIVVCTGQRDWTSRIEDDEGETGAFVRGLKGVVGKGGKAFDPFNPLLTTASSLPASRTPHTSHILLFPSFTRHASLAHTPSSLSAFASAHLAARTLSPFHSALPAPQRAALLRDNSPATRSRLPPAEPIASVTVLICGHGARDRRCGVLGPLLEDGFRRELARRGVRGAEVGVVSHVGGHKFAGNVVVYVPPGWWWRGRADDNSDGGDGGSSSSGNSSGSSGGDEAPHALAGTGVWYGRVGPEHVEGIVEETVVQGRIISELFRGGVRSGGGDLGRELEAQMKREKGEEEEGRLALKPKKRG